MSEKLLDECISIQLSFRKEQNPRRETIDAMYHKGALSLRCKSCGKQRQSGRDIGAVNRHSRKSGRFIEDHQGIVFVKHGKLMRETWPSPISLGWKVIRLF
jgi:hypothetical protein